MGAGESQARNISRPTPKTGLWGRNLCAQARLNSGYDDQSGVIKFMPLLSQVLNSSSFDH